MTPSSSSDLPRWARFLDFVCLLIVSVAVIIAMSGGFRVRLGDVRLALTSPWRLLLWGVAIGVVRHLVQPRPPIYRDLVPRVTALFKSAEWRAGARVFFGTRPAILFVGYLSVFMIGYGPQGAPWKIFENEFANLQARWDTGWYLGIAIDGYSYDSDHPGVQQNVVFFPAYPILMRGAARLFGGSPAAYMLGGTLLSLVAFVWALSYVYRFARDTLGDDDRANAAIWLLAAYPFALFYSAMYTESLYLLGVSGAFYHFRRSEFLRAGIWGLLVGLTRPPGVMLSLCLGLIAFVRWTPSWLPADVLLKKDHASQPNTSASLVPALSASAMPIAGLAMYSIFMWQLTGRPLVWQEGQFAWGREYNGLSTLVTQRYDWIVHGGLYSYTSHFSGDLLNVLGAVFVIATAWPVARRLGLAYAAFIVINILPPLAVGGFLSAGRFSSVLFPSFVWLATAVTPRSRSTWIASFIAVQALNTALFYTWRPLY